jgi:ferredoxin
VAAISHLSQHPYRLRLHPQAVTVPVAPGQTLLEAAQAAGIDLRRMCRNGTCRACLSRLVHGQVRHRVEWPGLSADEVEQGWILPCVALACGDVELDTRPP